MLWFDDDWLLFIGPDWTKDSKPNCGNPNSNTVHSSYTLLILPWAYYGFWVSDNATKRDKSATNHRRAHFQCLHLFICYCPTTDDMVQEHCQKMSSIINVPATAIFIPVSSFNGIFNGLLDFVFIKNDPQAGLMMTEDGLGDLQQLHCYVRALLWLDQFLDGFSRQQVAQNIYKRLCFKIFHAIKLYINMVSTVKNLGI